MAGGLGCGSSFSLLPSLLPHRHPHRPPSALPWNQARFDAGELITQRELVSRQVSDDLTERAATFGLILDDVSLVRCLWGGTCEGGAAVLVQVLGPISGWTLVGPAFHVPRQAT